MRKRQWKKILSVVLALAMVFSMNVSAFADEVTDPVAVEEPAAEQPVAEAPSEEPAPAAEEPEETPAPVEEEAPAKGEEAAGAITGWSLTTDGTENTDYEIGDNTITFKNPGTLVDAYTLTLTDASSASDITLDADGSVTTPADITVTVANGSTDPTVYKTITNTAGVTLAGNVVTIGGTTYAFNVAKAADTGVAFDAVPEVVEGATSITFTLSTAPGVAGTVELYKGGVATGTIVDIAAAGTSAAFTGLTPVVKDEVYKAVFTPNTTNPYYINESTIKVDKTAESAEITVVEAPAPDPEGTFTVSGFKFSMTNTVSSMSYADGVGEVAFTKGDGEEDPVVTVAKEGSPQKAISINLAEGVTAKFASSVDDYKYFSVKGKGTILTDGISGDPVFAKAFENVAAGVSISTNTTLLISANNAGKPEYVPIFAYEDAAYVSKGGKVVAVGLGWSDVKRGAEDVLPDDNKLFDTSDFTGDVVMLSENAPYFTTIESAKVGEVTVSDSRIEGVSVKYGEKLIVFDGGTATDLDGAYVIDVPKKGTYKWETRILDGMARNNGIDVDLYKNSKNEPYTDYKFVLSSNGGATGKASAEKNYPGNWQDGSDGYIQNLTEEATQIKDKKEKTFYLYARRKADAEFYKSDVTEVFSFDKLETVSISLNLANPTLSPNYIGDYGIDSDDLKKLAGNTNVINRNFFDFKFTGFKEGTHVVDGFGDGDYWNDNIYTVLDADNFKVGIIEIRYAMYDPNPVNMAYNFENDYKGAYYGLNVNEGAKYAAELSFTSDGEGTKDPTTVYNDITSSYSGYKNLVSFNVIKAPVKYEPVLGSPVAVSGQLDGLVKTYKATNTITGLYADTIAGAPTFYINGLEAKNAASWNELKPGTYTISISQGSIDDTADPDNYETENKAGKGDYSATTTLKVVDPSSAEGLKVSGVFTKDVYYGEPIAAVKNSISASFTFGGVDVTTDPYEHAGDVVILEAPSSNIAAAKKVDETKTISANTTLYAYIYNVNHDVAGKSLGPVSSDAIPFKILPRPVDVSKTDGKPVTSYRGEPLTTSVNKADLKLSVRTYFDGSYYPYEGEELTAEKFFADDKFININTSRVDSNKPGKYDVAITGYTVSSGSAANNYAQNYVIRPTDEKLGEDNENGYQVLGKWYVKYILEYGGRGATAGKRYVSSDEVIVEAEDGSKNAYGSKVKFMPSSKVTNSWNGILPEGDTITKWEVKRASDLKDVEHGEYDKDDNEVVAFDDNYSSIDYGNKAEVKLSTYDFAVYAVVAAQATKEGVMVESISPVLYDGMAHVTAADQKNTTNGDLGELVIYDEKLVDVTDVATNEAYWNKNYSFEGQTADGKKNIWRKDLVQGEDFTVSYKNNKNASVAYDRTVSGDDGADATFKRIVTDKKMPQVVIKGKGDFKSLKTTVLFDIIPADYGDEWYVASAPAEYQFAGKTLNKKATLADTIITKWDPRKTKTYKLKEGKANSKKLSGFTGDYVLKVYKEEKNGTRTEVTNFKKIAEGTYKFVYTGVNNYTGTTTETVNVVTGQLLSKQTIKYKKKITWAKDIKANDFVTQVKMKKAPKSEIPNIKPAEGNDKAGYMITNAYSTTGGNVDYVDGVYYFRDAGKYNIVLSASNKLRTDSQIYGTHTITVEVKGTKVKPADFKINDKKASKTVILDYDGKSQLVKVTSKWTSDDDSKVPTTMPSKKVQVTDGEATYYGSYEQAALENADYDWDYAPTILNNYDFQDTGADFEATQTGRGVYNVAPVANNSSLFDTYYIYIKPSGKYTAGTSTGYVVLSYKRGGLDLKKVVGTDLFKVSASDVPVNVGGTPAKLSFKVAGMGEAENYDITSAKSRVNFGGEDVFEITYKNNKKVGTGKATIKPTKYGKNYFKKSATVNYNIKTNEVKSVREFDVDGMDDGEVFAVITDAVKPKRGDVKVNAVLYQMDACGGKFTKLGKKDYVAALGKADEKKGYTVTVTDGTSGNFKFAKDTLVKNADETDNAYFNVYDAKTKVKVTLSQGEASGYDAAKKGYVYTGKEISPAVTSITYGGQTYNFGAGLTASDNFIVTYDKNVKVGTATAKVTLKRNVKAASANEAYPFGGTVTVKYKIVPHENNKLILSE